MSEYKTTSLSKFGHVEMVAEISDEYKNSVDWLFSYLESAVGDGCVFKAGRTIQLGWMIVMLVDRKDGTLEFWEPIFDQMPIKWCSGLNRTMQDLAVQSEVCRNLGLVPTFPSILDVGLLSDTLSDGRFEFIMSRDTPTERDCGWGFQELHPKHLSVKYASLFEIALSRPMIVPSIAIPQICCINFMDGGFSITKGERMTSWRDTEFFQKLLISGYFNRTLEA